MLPERINLLYPEGGQILLETKPLVYAAILLLVLAQACALAFAGWYISRLRKAVTAAEAERNRESRAHVKTNEKYMQLEDEKQAWLLRTRSYEIVDGPHRGRKFETTSSDIIMIAIRVEQIADRITYAQYDREDSKFKLGCLCQSVIKPLLVDDEDDTDEDD